MKRIFISLLFLFTVVPSVSFATFGGNDDGFHTNDATTAVDGLQSHAVTTNFRDVGGSASIGSFDSTEGGTGTSRTPLRLFINSQVAVAAGNNTVAVTVYTGNTCSGTEIYSNIYTNNNDLLGQPNLFTTDITTSLFDGYIGELCVRTNVFGDNAVGARVNSSQTGIIGLAPFINNSNVTFSKINYFETQELYHNIQNVSQISSVGVLLRKSTSFTNIKGLVDDTTPSTSFTQQLINMTVSVIPNHMYYYSYNRWADGGSQHVGFHTNSIRGGDGDPNSPTFNITTLIFCNNYTYEYSLLNRGEITRNTIQLRQFDNVTVLNNTLNVIWESNYTVGGVSQFRNTTVTPNSTGHYNANTTIATTASASLDFIGTTYDWQPYVSNPSFRRENMTCIVPNAFTVSSAYNTTGTFEKTKYWLGNTFTSFLQVKNARQEVLASVSPTMNVYDSTNLLRYTQTSATNSTGFITMTGNYVTKPTGTWTVNGTITHNGNTEIATTGTTTVGDKAGEDPLVLLPTFGSILTGQKIYANARSRELDGLSLSGQVVNYSVIFPDLTTTIYGNNTPEIRNTGNYKFNFTASQQGTYEIGINMSYQGVTYSDVQYITVQDSPSGLNSDQNATLYNINTTTTQTNTTINSQTWMDLIAARTWVYTGARTLTALAQSIISFN